MTGRAVASPPLRLADPDWLHHRLTVSGRDEVLAAFAASARGAGTIPWSLDLGRLQEDLFLLLAAPAPSRRRSLSLTGARVLARQLAEASAARHEAAVARVGRSLVCPFDLHVLVPVPPEVLDLGADHPEALGWLWAHWGTTEALRHVALELAPVLRVAPPAGTSSLHYSFWSADWTPWRAVTTLRQRWPALCFTVRPSYGLL